MPSQNQHRSTPLRAASTNNLVRTGEQIPQHPCLSGRTTRAPQTPGNYAPGATAAAGATATRYWLLPLPVSLQLPPGISWDHLPQQTPCTHILSQSLFGRNPNEDTQLLPQARGWGEGASGSAGPVHPVIRAARVCDWCREGAAAPRKGGWAERWSRQMDLEG